MTGQALTTELSMTFPDEKTREDFEIALRGFIKQYQMQATAALAAQGGSAPSSGDSGGGQGLSGSSSGGHSYGKDGGGSAATSGSQAQALFRAYLNFIPGW